MNKGLFLEKEQDNIWKNLDVVRRIMLATALNSYS